MGDGSDREGENAGVRGDSVELGKKIKVRRVGAGKRRMVQFKLNGRVFEAIKQNRAKPSRWGKLAREKHPVVQFGMCNRISMWLCRWMERCWSTEVSSG